MVKALIVRLFRLAARHFGETSVGADPIADMTGRLNETEIYKTVYELQNFGTRAYGYSKNALAAEYIYSRLSLISGLVVEYQGSYRNVIATLPGVDLTSSAVYVVGAHYDSTSSDPINAPGSTDNGGGVAIVLELARVMSQYRFSNTLKFAFWNAEENGMLGSNGYAKYAYENSLNISLYMNFDSASYEPDGGLILDVMYNSESQWVSNLMTEHNTVYGVGFALTYNAHTCGSDHRSLSYGYTAIMTHSETHGAQYHTASDTAEKISTAYARKNGQLGMSVLAELADCAGS